MKMSVIHSEVLKKSPFIVCDFKGISERVLFSSSMQMAVGWKFLSLMCSWFWSVISFFFFYINLKGGIETCHFLTSPSMNLPVALIFAMKSWISRCIILFSFRDNSKFPQSGFQRQRDCCFPLSEIPFLFFAQYLNADKSWQRIAAIISALCQTM